MITVKDVRDFLNNLPERVPDATIDKQIEIANTKVQSEKSADATSNQVQDATLVYAAYLTMIAYAAQLERSVGVTPPQVARQIDLLNTLSEAMLQYVKRGSLTLQPLVAQPASMMEQYEDGDFEGECY